MLSEHPGPSLSWTDSGVHLMMALFSNSLLMMPVFSDRSIMGADFPLLKDHVPTPLTPHLIRSQLNGQPSFRVNMNFKMNRLTLIIVPLCSMIMSDCAYYSKLKNNV